MTLNSRQIKQLRASGHRQKLKPVVIVGQQGLGAGVHAEIEQALAHHELIKLRLPGGDRSWRRELSESICREHSAELVEAIGGVIVIYRRNPERDRYAETIGQARGSAHSAQSI